MKLIKKQKGVNDDTIEIYLMEDGSTIAINDRTGGIVNNKIILYEN